MRAHFWIGSLKGATYSPAWGLSCGLVPLVKGPKFRHVTSDKKAVPDLTIDPIDETGKVDAHTFSFITGADKEIPAKAIEACAAHFVPLAFSDFDRASDLRGFCELFGARRALKSVRFKFHMYLCHRLSEGFVDLLLGHAQEGKQRIETFCGECGLAPDDPVLSECMRRAEATALNVSTG